MRRGNNARIPGVIASPSVVVVTWGHAGSESGQVRGHQRSPARPDHYCPAVMRVRRVGFFATVTFALLAALSVSWTTDAHPPSDLAGVMAPVTQLPTGALLRTDGGRQLPLFLDRHDAQRSLSGRALAGALVLTAELALVECIVAAMTRRARAQRLTGAVHDRGPPGSSRTGQLLCS